MSPDQMDAMDRMLENVDPAIRAVHAEVKALRGILLEANKEIKDDLEKENAKLEKQIHDGFSAITAQCKERLCACNKQRVERDLVIAGVVKEQAINKGKLGILVGGSAFSGGIGAKIIEWLTK